MFKLDGKLVSSALNMFLVLAVLSTIAAAVQNDGSSTVQAASAVDGVPSSEDLAELRREEWEKAEEQYGLYRPSPGETVIVVHRQTSKSLAVASVTWDDIPVHYNMLPEEILSDIAHWYNDIHDD